MSTGGRTSGAPGKGNAGGERGGNRGGGKDQQRSGAGPRSGHQSHGSDPHRGEKFVVAGKALASRQGTQTGFHQIGLGRVDDDP